jgi:hypothetical protein
VNEQQWTSNQQQSTLRHQERFDPTTAHHLQAPFINIDHWRSSTNLIIKDNKNNTIDIYGKNNGNQPNDQTAK